MIKLKLGILVLIVIIFTSAYAQPKTYRFNSLEVSGTENDETKTFQHYFELYPGKRYSETEIQSEISAVKRRLNLSDYYMLADIDYDLEDDTFDLYADLTSGFPYLVGMEGFGILNFSGQGDDFYFRWLNGMKLSYSKKSLLTTKDYIDFEYGSDEPGTEKKDIGFIRSFKFRTDILEFGYGYRFGDWTIAAKPGTSKITLNDLSYSGNVSDQTINDENQSNTYIQLETEFNSLNSSWLPDSGLNCLLTWKLTEKQWSQGDLLVGRYQKINPFVWAIQFKTGFLQGDNVPLAEYYYNDSLIINGRKSLELSQQLRYKIGEYSQGLFYGTLTGYGFYSLINMTSSSIDSLISGTQPLYGVGINLYMPFYSVSLDLRYQIKKGKGELLFSTTDLF